MRRPVARFSLAFRFLLRVAFACAVFAPVWVGAQMHRLPAAPEGVIESGVPLFEIRSSDSMGLDMPPTDLRLLPDGRLIAFARRQFAIGDGVRWEVLNQAAGDPTTPANQVAIDDDGTIYVGTPTGLARVEFSEDGKWRLHEIETWTENRPILRNVIQIGRRWFWHGDSGSLVSWQPGDAPRDLGPADAVSHAFTLQGNYYASDNTAAQLWRLAPDGGANEIIPQTGIGHTPLASAPFAANRVLLGTNTQGLQIFDGRKMEPLRGDEILGAGARIVSLSQIKSGHFVAAVEGRGIIFFDRQGRVLQVLDRASDHRLASARQLISGPGGAVWALLNDGVLRTEFPSRFSQYESLYGAASASAHPHRYQGVLWLLNDGTLRRAIYDRNGRLDRFEIDTPPAFAFTFSTHLGIPVVGSDNGSYYRGEGGWVLFAPELREMRITDTHLPDGRWLWIANGKTGWIRRTEEGSLEYTTEELPELDRAYGLQPAGDGWIWVERGAGRIMRIRAVGEKIETEFFGREHGLPSGWVQVFAIGDELYFNAGDRIHRFDEATKRFSVDPGFLAQLPGVTSITGRPALDASGNLWITADGSLQVLKKTPDGWRPSGIPTPTNILPYFFAFEDNGVVWMHSRRRLTRYDPNIEILPPPPLRALITQVSLPVSGRTYYSGEGTLPEFHHRDNSFIINFVTPGASLAEPVQFDVRLDGHDANWVSMGSAGSAVFTRLKPGDYVLRVRPHSGRQTGEEATLAFKIRPPLYATRYAYGLYALLGIAAIFGATRVSSYLGRREKLRLEALVARRTRELNASNDQLAAQVEEIRILSQAIDQSPVAVLIARPHGNIVFANPRACELTGFSARELIGRNLNQLSEQPLSLDRESAVQAALQRRETWHGQLTDRSKSGRLVPVRVTVSAIRDSAGEITYLLVLKEDISEQLAEQERRQRLESQLFQSQKLESLGTLAGGIAHDFNNILTAILGYCELAKLDLDTPDAVHRDLEQIRSAGLRAKDVVAQILTFSRQSNPKLVPLDLAGPVAEALKLVRASMPSTIDLSVTLESGAVLADFTQIQQVVLNLCTNAMHAMREHPGTIRISLRAIEATAEMAAELPPLQPGRCMCLTVADHGIGMDRSTLDRVFDPFFTTKKPGEGTGLGLAIVQGIVATHRGAIRVRSSLGVGSTFELYFPVTDQNAEQPSAIAADAPRGNNEAVLVVDDEPAVARFVSARLEQLNYCPTECHDPVEAAAMLKHPTTSFAAVVTDLTMPQLTGVDLVHKLRDRGDDIPSVIITGYGTENVRAAISALPHCVVLQKPFSGEELAAALHNVMSSHRAHARRG